MWSLRDGLVPYGANEKKRFLFSFKVVLISKELGHSDML